MTLSSIEPVLAAKPKVTPPPEPLLRVNGLAINFGGRKTPMGAVDDASFDVGRGETVCLVGESGCGKTVTALSLLRLDTAGSLPARSSSTAEVWWSWAAESSTNCAVSASR
jgi:ABC-type glutathione transport system ATPase component